jgi:hypothetical protein
MTAFKGLATKLKSDKGVRIGGKLTDLVQPPPSNPVTLIEVGYLLVIMVIVVHSDPSGAQVGQISDQ